jgi:hypothetical protein
MDAKLVCQTVGGQFFLFCKNYMDAKLVCQTAGVALTYMQHVWLTVKQISPKGILYAYA